MIEATNGRKWRTWLVIVMMAFATVCVSVDNSWAVGIPLPTNDQQGNSKREQTKMEKLKANIKKAQTIALQIKDLAQRGYAAACKAYAVGKAMKEAALSGIDVLKNDALNMAKNYGNCEKDVITKIAKQQVEDTKKCKQDYKEDPEGYKTCKEDAKIKRQTMKKEMKAQCKEQKNKDLATLKANAKQSAQASGELAASGAKDVKNTIKPQEGEKNQNNQSNSSNMGFNWSKK